MKTGKSKTVLLHLVLWLLFSAAWFLSVEPLLHIAATGFHNVNMWVFAEITGLLFVFMVIGISLLVQMRKR